jgi:hypothetical protein
MIDDAMQRSRPVGAPESQSIASLRAHRKQTQGRAFRSGKQLPTAEGLCDN